MKKIINEPKNFFYPHLVAITIGMIFFCFFLQTYILVFNDYKIQKLANYEEDFATIVYYKTVLHKGYTDYTVCYEYKDGDNIYFGNYESRIKSELDAKNMIGKKVPIYVDHNLKLQTLELNSSDSLKTGIYFNLVGIILMFLLCVNSLIRLILYYIKLKAYNKYKAEEEVQKNEIDKKEYCDNINK